MNTKRDSRSSNGGPKVLRVGIVQNGKIIEEQELRKRERVTIGYAPKCTFQVTSDRLPESFELFDYDGKSYFLHFDNHVSGRIQLEDEQVADFKALEARGLVVQRSGRKAVQLNDKSRGKVMIGDVTVLFQFKTVSPTPKPPELPADVRGSFLQNIDTQFAAIFVVVALLQISFITYARSLPYVEPTSIAELDERFQRMIMPDREPTPARTPVAQPDPTKPSKEAAEKEEPKEEPEEEEAKKEPEKEKKADKRKRSAEEQQAAARAERQRKVAGRGLLKVLGAKREGGGGALADVFSEGGATSSLEDAFSETKGIDIATEGGSGGSRGGGEGESVGVGALGTAGGGSVSSTGKKRETAIRGELAEQTPEIDGELDPDSIRRVLKRKSGAIKACYERALKRNRNLKGKIIISFEIDRRGRVRNISFGGSLKSQDIERCIATRARRWRFPRPEGGSVFVDYPVVVTPTG